jgi:hypothetical protein
MAQFINVLRTESDAQVKSLDLIQSGKHATVRHSTTSVIPLLPDDYKRFNRLNFREINVNKHNT